MEDLRELLLAIAERGPNEVSERIRDTWLGPQLEPLQYAHPDSIWWEVGLAIGDGGRPLRPNPEPAWSERLRFETSRYLPPWGYRLTIGGRVVLEGTTLPRCLLAVAPPAIAQRLPELGWERVGTMLACSIRAGLEESLNGLGCAVLDAREGVRFRMLLALEDAFARKPAQLTVVVDSDSDHPSPEVVAFWLQRQHPLRVRRFLEGLALPERQRLATGFASLSSLSNEDAQRLRQQIGRWTRLQADGEQDFFDHLRAMLTGQATPPRLPRSFRLAALLTSLPRPLQGAVIGEMMAQLEPADGDEVIMALHALNDFTRDEAALHQQVAAELMAGERWHRAWRELPLDGLTALAECKRLVRADTIRCARYITRHWGEEESPLSALAAAAAASPRALARRLIHHQPRRAHSGREKLAALIGCLDPTLTRRLAESLMLVGRLNPVHWTKDPELTWVAIRELVWGLART
ncbi:MAG: hypothetical protein KC910_09085 [Candidatus Eremiobacteraeota bacterium]|nr:hypothetical protein [Candidatus Eremiobacteraeota bacterium]